MSDITSPIATDATLQEVVEAIKNSATVQAQKKEIQTEGQKQITSTQNEGKSQVDAIKAEGTRVLNSIPQDYKETLADIGGLRLSITENGLLHIERK